MKGQLSPGAPGVYIGHTYEVKATQAQGRCIDDNALQPSTRTLAELVLTLEFPDGAKRQYRFLELKRV